eukprot:1176867-Prorocentrum_minimum.AAC.3
MPRLSFRCKRNAISLDLSNSSFATSSRVSTVDRRRVRHVCAFPLCGTTLRARVSRWPSGCAGATCVSLSAPHTEPSLGEVAVARGARCGRTPRVLGSRAEGRDVRDPPHKGAAALDTAILSPGRARIIENITNSPRIKVTGT